MLITVLYTHVFIREIKKLEPSLQEEVLEKIELFANTDNHAQLKVHKLKGKLKDRYSFSVNYSHRIVFCYLTKNRTALLTVGDHDVYKH